MILNLFFKKAIYLLLGVVFSILFIIAVVFVVKLVQYKRIYERYNDAFVKVTIGMKKSDVEMLMGQPELEERCGDDKGFRKYWLDCEMPSSQPLMVLRQYWSAPSITIGYWWEIGYEDSGHVVSKRCID